MVNQNSSPIWPHKRRSNRERFDLERVMLAAEQQQQQLKQPNNSSRRSRKWRNALRDSESRLKKWSRIRWRQGKSASKIQLRKLWKAKLPKEKHALQWWMNLLKLAWLPKNSKLRRRLAWRDSALKKSKSPKRRCWIRVDSRTIAEIRSLTASRMRTGKGTATATSSKSTIRVETVATSSRDKDRTEQAPRVR